MKFPKGTTILHMEDPDFAEKLLDALGIAPGEKVEFVTPAFHRPPNDPPPASMPTDWSTLRSMNRQALKELGLCAWSEPDASGNVLMLLPGEWYPHIPAGTLLTDIFGEEEPFVPGVTDDDMRFGCLSYGIVVKDAAREKK